VFDIKGIEKMRAVAYTEYGLPEVAKLAEVSKPEPKVNELLIKVHASTVNRTDPGFRSAEYFVSRFWSGLLKQLAKVLLLLRLAIVFLVLMTNPLEGMPSTPFLSGVSRFGDSA